jgi:hypothetical protein
MLRFLTERRAWVVAAFVALMLVIGLRVWGAPRAAAHASDLIGERLGVNAHVEQASLSFGGVELLGIDMRGRHGGFVARIDRVDARISFLGALFRGPKAIRGVSAQGLEVTVDLGHEGFDDSAAELREKIFGSSPASAPASVRTGGRTYAISNLTVRVVDADGPLMLMKDVSLHKEGDDVRSGFAEMTLGERAADHVAVAPSRVALRRTEGAWQLHELEIDGADVRSLSNGDGGERALASRVRESLGRARGRETAAAAATATANENENENATETETETENATGQVQRGAESARLFDRLTPDARIDVSGVQIESRTSEGHVERIQDFGLALHGGDNGWFRVMVGGQTSNKGTLRVDLSVMPSEARADGSIRLRRISLAIIAPFAPQLPLYDTEVGTVSAEIELAASSADHVPIEGALRIRRLALASERIAAEPVQDINIDIGGKGVWHPDERLLQIERGQVRMGKTSVLIDGELERTADHYRVDLTAKLPPTACNDVVGAIPEDVLGSLALFEWSGNWSALTRISLDSRELEATELSIRVRNLCQFERTPKWVRVERFQEPFRHRAIEPDETVFEMWTGAGTDHWVAFAEISPFGSAPSCPRR